jgi:hypothetical protein
MLNFKRGDNLDRLDRQKTDTQVGVEIRYMYTVIHIYINVFYEAHFSHHSPLSLFSICRVFT